MIRIRNVNKTYTVDRRAVTALKDIQLDIGRGEIFGIIGRSGAGKSTLIRTLNLLERPSHGSIEIDGEVITELDDAGLVRLRQQVGMVFQHFNLLSSKTVLENICFPLKLAGQTPDPARINELLQLVGLEAHRDKYPSQLSGGQKQRVGIARALANSPKLLLCDEATSALDPQTTQAILKLLLEINQRLHLTIVLITHEMSVVRTICDRVAVIDGGEIVESGSVADIFLHPQHPATRDMLAETSGQDPAELNDILSDIQGPILSLTFLGAKTYEPVMEQVAREQNIHFNILHGTLGRIKHQPYGQLAIEVRELGTTTIESIVAAFERQQVRCEVVKK